MQRRFPNIPNVYEMLDAPAIQGLLQRFQPTVVASGMRTFWERMQTEVAGRSKDWTPPAPAELAEKVAAWLLQKPPAALRPAINGTGVLLPEESLLSPLGPTAGAVVGAFERQYGFGANDRTRGAHRELEANLTSLVGGQAALFFENEALAAFAICRAFAAGGATVKTALRDLERRSPAGTWVDLAKEAGVRMDACGSIEACAIEAYDLASGGSVWIWKHFPANAEVRGSSGSPTVRELADAVHERGGKLLVSLGVGALNVREELAAWNEPSVEACLEQGADLVLLRGDGLLGGPPCGIVVGTTAAIEPIEKQMAYSVGRLSPLTGVLLERILLAHASPQTDERVEILSLLSTSKDNLAHRAQRLAPQIAAMNWVAETEIRQTEAFLRSRNVASQAVDSVAVAIRPESMSVADVRARLTLGRPALYLASEGEWLIFDLRGLAPALDLAAIDALARLCSSERPRSADVSVDGSSGDVDLTQAPLAGDAERASEQHAKDDGPNYEE
jgi:L-seryl-tRNA(Ser) seleniumtransferase